MDKLIAIGGGVGPMAGVQLHKQIIENTKTDGSDQDHLEVHHLSRSQDIAFRTRFLLGVTNENPANGMFRTVKAIVKAADEVGKKAVVGVPCNTFHAPKIFGELLRLIDESGLDVEVVNMIEKTDAHLRRNYSEIKRIGLMSTTGTRKARVYNKGLEPFGYEIIEVPEEMQDELHDSIYNSKWGIKAITPVSSKTRENFLKYVDILIAQGAQAIILGCTEIPLALPEKFINGIPLIDPVFVLARALIREIDEEKLIPLEETF